MWRQWGSGLLAAMLVADARAQKSQLKVLFMPSLRLCFWILYATFMENFSEVSTSGKHKPTRTLSSISIVFKWPILLKTWASWSIYDEVLKESTSKKSVTSPSASSFSPWYRAEQYIADEKVWSNLWAVRSIVPSLSCYNLRGRLRSLVKQMTQRNTDRVLAQWYFTESTSADRPAEIGSDKPGEGRDWDPQLSRCCYHA